jgi:uncharacterized protein (TIGR03000 family)
VVCVLGTTFANSTFTRRHIPASQLQEGGTMKRSAFAFSAAGIVLLAALAHAQPPSGRVGQGTGPGSTTQTAPNPATNTATPNGGTMTPGANDPAFGRIVPNTGSGTNFTDQNRYGYPYQGYQWSGAPNYYRPYWAPYAYGRWYGYYPSAGYPGGYYALYPGGYYGSYWTNPGYQGYENQYGTTGSQYGSTGFYSGAYPSGYQSFYSSTGTNNQMRLNNEVLLHVSVPRSDARVWVENQATQQMGTNRMFVSPPLEKRQRYHYTIRATWMENGKEVSREKKVDVEPGREFTVNFSPPGDSGIAQPDQGRNSVGAEERNGLRPSDQRPADTPARGRDRNQEQGGLRPSDERRTDIQNRDASRTEQQSGLQAADGDKGRDAGGPIMGKVVRVEGDRVVVTLADGGQTRTYRIPNDARVSLDGAKSDISAIKPGMELSITTRKSNPDMIADLQAKKGRAPENRSERKTDTTPPNK